MPTSNEAEEPGETTAIISTQQFQPPQILRLISNSENASFHPRRRRINRRSSSRMNSRERLLAVKGRSLYSKAESQQASMANAGLTVSLFLLAAICGAHLLRTSTTDLTDVFKKSYFSSDIQIFIKSLYSNIHHHQPFTSHQLYNFDIQTKISQNINERFQRFVERLEEYVPSSITSASLNDWMLFGHFGERQELQVNVLLAERRRRTVQRQRSPTPIPQSISSPRFINRQRNTSSAPPDSLRSWAHLSTSPTSIQPSTSDFGTNSNQSNEPTLMDYDAIDSYWRWDIEQEKGGLSPYQRLNDFGHQLDEDYYYLNNERNFQETDILFERDIQLLTEKGLLPDQTNFLQDNLNDNEVNLLANFSRTLSFDGIIENQNENTKWNDLLQLPTSSLFVSSGQGKYFNFCI